MANDSKTGSQNQSSSSNTKKAYKLADFRHKSFDPGISGLDPITHEGTPVAQGKEEALLAAAEKQGVKIVEVKASASSD